ncbi:MAG: nicotinate-nucleotide--dimethylbenzimidazole phosphoribosyltransferase [Actinobacteria bacterium]|nr:nicotinate-nucleotide--dimethylbenzimidazole phosphoribosyltransferase [Actinomycetota bacterium]
MESDLELTPLIKSTISKIAGPDMKAAELAQARLDSLTKPQGSLGRLEELARQIASVTGVLKPDFSKKLIIVMAADHGVVGEGVSAYPSEVTPQMVYNFLRGGAGINVLAAHAGADVVVVDIGVAAVLETGSEIGKSSKNSKNISKTILKSASKSASENISKGIFINKKIGFGTKNMAKGAAMTIKQALAAIEAGISVANLMIENGYGIIGTGDMGIGNTTASSAIASCICGADVESVTGFGTGVDLKGYHNKVSAIKRAIEINRPDPADGLDVLSKIGGFEIGGIAGVILSCASKKVPVVIDGFISGAGALIAEALSPQCRDYMIASHCSVEKGHRVVLEKLKLKPLFDFDMRLGEGTGAALGITIAEAAVKILNEMATFGEAGVSGKNE